MLARTFVAFVFLALLWTFYYEYTNTPNLGTENTEYLDTENTENSDTEPILILHWSKAYEKYVFDSTDLEKCPDRCEVTTSRKMALKADAITFYGMHPLMKRFKDKLVDLRRLSKATFIFHSREPPTLTLALGNWSYNFFDATMTYRRDSQIFNGLYEFVAKSEKLQGHHWKRPDFTNTRKVQVHYNKTKMAIWLVSKCETAGEREKYIKEIQKYIDIDVFGRCGKRPLPRSISGLSGSDAILFTYRQLINPYFFYMSFEVK